MSLKVKEESKQEESSNSKGVENPASQDQSRELIEAVALIKQLKSELDKKSSPGNEIAQLAQAIKSMSSPTEKASEIRYRSYRDAEELDPDDVLETPITFYAYTSFYCIADNKVNDRSVLAPLGPITFEHVNTSKSQSGRDTSLVLVSRYMSRSKKEVEFLRSHVKYNINFFEKSNIHESVDIRYAQKISTIANMLSGKPVYDVIQLAKENNIIINGDDLDRQDAQRIKLHVATVLAQKEIQNEKVPNVKSIDDLADEILNKR